MTNADHEPTENPMPSEESEPENASMRDAAQMQALRHEILAATRVLFGLTTFPGAAPGAGPTAEREPGAIAEPSLVAELGSDAADETAPAPTRLRAVPSHPVSAPSPIAVPPPTALPLPDQVASAAAVSEGESEGEALRVSDGVAQAPASEEEPTQSAYGTAHATPANAPTPGGIPLPEMPSDEPHQAEEESADDPAAADEPVPARLPSIPVPRQTDAVPGPSVKAPGENERPRGDRRSMELLQEIAFLDE
jgi:hypothetical protein